ncbi:MAG: hypothetical protein COS89_09805 [Deltaproteobacteria bacterium CG07_land_8_20_14_0_80_38_7]|nr:MAG: hypothetical protein COS89_09805 [Deltaproteobacteria bacterium CG07_land_8_20_14_0_80_38_7]
MIDTVKLKFIQKNIFAYLLAVFCALFIAIGMYSDYSSYLIFGSIIIVIYSLLLIRPVNFLFYLLLTSCIFTIPFLSEQNHNVGTMSIQSLRWIATFFISLGVLLGDQKTLLKIIKNNLWFFIFLFYGFSLFLFKGNFLSGIKVLVLFTNIMLVAGLAYKYYDGSIKIITKLEKMVFLSALFVIVLEMSPILTWDSDVLLIGYSNVSTILVFPAIMALNEYIFTRNKNYFFIYLFMSAMTFLAMGRMGICSLLLCSFVGVFFQYKSSKIKKVFMLFFVMFFLGLIGYLLFPQLQKRMYLSVDTTSKVDMDEITRGSNIRFTGRLALWTLLLQEYSSSKLFGLGPSSSEYIGKEISDQICDHPHSQYLLTIVDFGIVGCLLITQWLFTLFKKMLKCSKSSLIQCRYLSFLMFLLFIHLGIVSVGDTIVYYPTTISVIFAVFLGIFLKQYDINLEMEKTSYKKDSM